ncbi:MAG: undecaprenyl-diphosphate phosphatase [Lachnospiraceae bacterium]|nr:undecaprenyl-diphosphate phosphatase [Lachnospiraceae bacterium]MDY5742292.1 undecaprenyl-diphosphate phosphatase [Lachnospiraceae bacterium]
MLNLVKVIVLGILEGITEWLPVSSTGHLQLLQDVLKPGYSDAFMTMFQFVIQLGAIFAVILLYWQRIWPFRIEQEQTDDGQKRRLRVSRRIMILWSKIIITSIPAAMLGLLLDDFADKYLHRSTVIAIALIVYGIAFIIMERRNVGLAEKDFRIADIRDIDYKTALGIGFFQVLAIVPGTSRSGSTIIGSMLLGTTRKVAATFSFYMAIPIMFGISFLKIIKFGFHFTAVEAIALLIGMLVSFAVSVLVISFFMKFIRKHSFVGFGYYRIALGILVLTVDFLR